MLKLIATELKKLRRKKMVWLMMLSSLFMPFMTFLLFRYRKDPVVDPMQFYRWAALGYTVVIILPIVLGIFATMLAHEEKSNDVIKQLWIIPVKRSEYLVAKSCVLLLYSVTYMMITASATIQFAVCPGYVPFGWDHILFLLERCLEIGILSALAILPILAAAVAGKGIILPVCLTFVYAIAAFCIMPVNIYVLPLTNMMGIVLRGNRIPGISFGQSVNVPIAVMCMMVWSAAVLVFARAALNKK